MGANLTTGGQISPLGAKLKTGLQLNKSLRKIKCQTMISGKELGNFTNGIVSVFF
jgi:hypothetical protein